MTGGTKATRRESPPPPLESPTQTSGHSQKAGSSPLTPVAVEGLQIHRVEALTDAEQKNSDHDESDQDRERDANLHHQRHALGPRRGENETVLQGHEADHLPHG